MNAHCKSGYLFDRNIRFLPIISWISGMGITAFSIFLWYLVVYDDSLLVIPYATVFTAFNIFFIFRAIKSRDFTESTYTCRDHSAAVLSGRFAHSDGGAPLCIHAECAASHIQQQHEHGRDAACCCASGILAGGACAAGQGAMRPGDAAHDASGRLSA